MMADFQKISIFGKAGSPNSGKSDSSESAGTSPLCPQCGSKKLWRDGLRYSPFGDRIQRWLCRNCGYRFSDSDDVQRALSAFERVERVDTKAVKGRGDKALECQICVEETKNLAATELKTVAGESKQLAQIDARILQYEWKCKKRNLGTETIKKRKELLARLIRAGGNLADPETIEETLANGNYTPSIKLQLVNVYRSYCKMFNIQWLPIKVRYEPKVPYMPTEEECKVFIAGFSKVTSIFCRVLYETGARCGEACKIEWTDINEENNTIAINHPLKGSNARLNRVSPECINLLKTLRKKHGKYVFNPNPRALHSSFRLQRHKLAAKLGRPQLLKIHFHTFRHVRGTMDVHNHIPLYEVKENLGHKCITNTEKYIHFNRQLFHEKNDRYHFAAVSTVEDAGKLIENGYEYVTDMEGTKLFRKAK
jgi:integrase